MPITTEERTARLANITFFGKPLEGALADALLHVNVSMSIAQTSQVKFVFEDQGYRFLQQGYFSPGLPVFFGNNPMEVTSISTGGDNFRPEVTVICRSRGIRRLKRMRGEKVMSNVSPTQFVVSECKEAQIDYLVQSTDERSVVSRDTHGNYDLDTPAGRAEFIEHYGYGTDRVDDSRPSAWTTLQRLAGECGFMVYESEGLVHFGKPSWLLAYYQSSAVRATWDTNNVKTDLPEVPLCVKSLDSTDGPDITLAVPMNRVSSFKPGQVCYFEGIPAFQGYYLIRESQYDLLADDTENASVIIGLPDDPAPQSAENVWGGITILPSGPVAAVQQNLDALFGVSTQQIAQVKTPYQPQARTVGNGQYIGADGKRRATPQMSFSDGKNYLAGSLIQFWYELNDKYADRDTGMDSWLDESIAGGDALPDSKGCVHALTFSTTGIDVDTVINMFSRDNRALVIYNGSSKWSGDKGWRKVRVNGEPMFTNLVRVVIKSELWAESNTSPWGLSSVLADTEGQTYSTSRGNTSAIGGGLIKKYIPVETFVGYVTSRVGTPYMEGYEASPSDISPAFFDASELVQWAAARAGVSVPDTVLGQWNSIVDARLSIGIDAALTVRGALLFKGDRQVAVSLGDGRVVEAVASVYAVTTTTVANQTIWTGAGLLPGFRYDIAVSESGQPILDQV